MSFAGADTDVSFCPVDLVKRQLNDFARAQPHSLEHQQDGMVAQLLWTAIQRAGKNAFGLGSREIDGKCCVFPRRHRGNSRWSTLRKAYDLLWIARKLGVHADSHVTVEQVRSLVVNRSDREDTGGPQLHILSIRKRLIANACAWLRYLGYLREPIEPIPFGSQLDEYSGWARQECGLSDATIARFCGTVRQFLRWYGPFGRQRTYLSARRYEGGFDDTIPNLSTSAPNKPPQAAPLSAPIVTRSTARPKASSSSIKMSPGR